MQLISGIEVAYFRSIYKQKLDELAGTNILFGRNDSGKSNVLRALNLFFNNETNPGQAFSFERDFAHSRLHETESAGASVRKFVYVKVWFNTPANWRNSLGSEFWVRRQWSVTRQSDPIVDSSVKESAKQQYLTRFLNKVRLHYVPAIKDRRIFEKLLGDIYGVVAGQKEFLTSLRSFSEDLQEHTKELTDGLLESLSLSSVVAPPTDLTDLFRSLDFETQSEHGDSYSLTLQRGDGVQVRHIPAILAFLSDRSQEDFHIWAFEEPENSLELASAIEEAQQFCKYGDAENKQVFLTSHSPAFFSLERDDVVRIFVSRSGQVAGRRCSNLIRFAEGNGTPSEMMGETPHLPIISSYLQDADSRIKQLRAEQDALMEQLKKSSRCLLFLEGESDVVILKAAWRTFAGPSAEFDFVDCNGTKKMEGLAGDGALLNRLSPGRGLFVLVDNDQAGRSVYKNGRLGDGGKWIPHGSNGTHWCRLPYAAEMRKAMKSLSVPESHWPGSIENLFSAELRKEAIADEAYAVFDEPHSELLEHFRKVKNAMSDPASKEHLYVMAPGPQSKIQFAKWVAQRSGADPTILEPLRGVVEGLQQRITATVATSKGGHPTSD